MRYATGRELDALVAEKVFGAKVAREEKKTWSGKLAYVHYTTDIKLEKPCCGCAEDRMNPTDFFVVPEYSTNIAKAWEVVQHFLEKLQWDVYVFTDQGELDEWICELKGGTPYKEVRSESTNAPEAICWAALKALG